MVNRAQIRAWAASQSRNYDQECQALMWQLQDHFGTASNPWPGSAWEAYHWELAAGRIQGGTPPPGSWVYLDIGKWDHVGYVLDNGDIFWGTKFLQETWGVNTGISSLAYYTGKTGAKVYGWSWMNGGKTLPFEGGGGGGGGIDYAWGLTTAAQLAVQNALYKLGYYKLDRDGVFGGGSVTSFMNWLIDNGYLLPDYKVDGEPGPIYGKAVQTLAAKFGYTFEIDGYPAENTSAAIERWAASILVEPTAPVLGTTGIDVSKSQRLLDYNAAKAQGISFVIVKAGGRNVLPEYVADSYPEHVSAAKAAGLHVGHYYVPGKGKTPAAQAEFLASILVGFNVETDVLALDNEPLDDNGIFWKDAEVAEFVTRLHEVTGIPFSRIWVYFPASLTRNNAPWPLTQALQVKRWWAAYGDNPTGWKPDHEPNLQGSLSDWDIHQYSSNTKVGAVTVDANYSRMPVADLFAVGTVVPPITPEPEPEPPVVVPPVKPGPSAGLIAAISAIVVAAVTAILALFNR